MSKNGYFSQSRLIFGQAMEASKQKVWRAYFLIFLKNMILIPIKNRLFALSAVLGWCSTLFPLVAQVPLLPPTGAAETRSGLPYVLHTQHNGKKPVAGNIIYFHAEIGSESRFLVDSRKEEGFLSVEIPKSWASGNSSPAPIEELSVFMGIGDSATVWVPIERFAQRPPGFDQAKYYVVRMVLADIKTPGAEQRRQQMARFGEVQAQTREKLRDYLAGRLKETLSETPSGLRYQILKPGEGPNARPRQTVWVHYLGMLSDGKTFDDSIRKGEPFKFILGRKFVIQGWEEGIALLNPGAEAVFFIPAHLAYGEEGAGDRIPPGAELAFFIQLEKVK